MATHSPPANLPHFPQILKLDRTNYAFWRAQALSAIRAHGFHEFIDPMAQAPPLLPSSSTSPPNSAWLRRDQYLLSWMLSSVTESMLGHVVRCSSSREFWSVLERLFMSQSKARIMQLRLLLQTTKKGAMSVEEFFLKMRSYADQLSAVGQIINDDELIMYILSGLGPEYEALVVNIMHRSDNQNLQEIQYSFQAYELRLQQQNVSSGFELAAHVAYRSQSR
ncbi:uncharacterized protein LOC131018337 [Salvia miltiorrhiza]|uniref:uncharacterized protein LOC131018337 n=1 Tax=Salvia miltiorrhiza TaxID=226208 RepID=UPI0025AC3384|nr:uncharacterized protein LOC131018337 [Salvia miltiorrhiza]